MSYSYIKSVFPNYSTEDDPNVGSQLYTSNLTLGGSVETNTKINSPVSPYESSSFVETFNGESNKDNLHFRVPPVPTISIESFSKDTNVTNSITNTNCEDYLQHVLKCKACSNALRKQLGVGRSVEYEELVEVFAFILFGVFLLMLLERFKK